MTRLTKSDKEIFMDIVREDMQQIHMKVSEQVNAFWDKARELVLIEKGHDKIKARIEEIRENKRLLIEEQNKLENEIRSEKLNVQQQIELGAKPDRYGCYRGANFFGIPVSSVFEYQIMQKIKENIDLKAPAKFLHDLGRSSLREIAMSGTFEDAQKTYSRFYKMDFRKYDVDIPPRLSEMKKSGAKVLAAPKALKRIEADKEW